MLFRLKSVAVATALACAAIGSAQAGISSTALPAGATVTSGSATITPGANSLTISASGNAVITYSGGFNVGSQATVTVNGGNVLNIDTSGTASEIDGTINGNASGVFIANANGIVVGNGASINLPGAFGLAAQDLTGSAQINAFSLNGTMPSNMVKSPTGASIVINNGATIIAGSAVVNANGNIVNSGNVTAAPNGSGGSLTFVAGNQFMNYGTLTDNASSPSDLNTIITTPNGGAQINILAGGASGPYNLGIVNQSGGIIQTNGSVFLGTHDNILNYGQINADGTNGWIVLFAGDQGSTVGSIYGGVGSSMSSGNFYFKYAGDITGGIVQNSSNPQPGDQFHNGVTLYDNGSSHAPSTVVYLFPLNLGVSRQNVNLYSPTAGVDIVPILSSSLVSQLANASNAPVDPSFVPSNLFVRAFAGVGLGNVGEPGAGSTFYWPGLMYIEPVMDNTLATPISSVVSSGAILLLNGATTVSNVVPVLQKGGLGVFWLSPTTGSGNGTLPQITINTNGGSNVNTLDAQGATTILVNKSAVNTNASAGLAPAGMTIFTPPSI